MSKRIAASLLRAGGNEAVNDLLFDRAKLLHPTPLPYRVSDAQANRLYKGDLPKVVSIATDSRTSPEILLRYARDTRVSVRDALIQNPSTPYEAIEMMATWIMQREELAGAQVLVDRLTPDDLVTAMGTIEMKYRVRASGMHHYQQFWFPSKEAAMKIASSGSRETFLRAGALCYPGVTVHLAVWLIANGGPISLTELLEETPKPVRDVVVLAVAANVDILTVELAEHLALVEVDKHSRVQVTPKSYALAEEGSFKVLIATRRSDLVGLAVYSNASSALLSEAIKCADMATLHQMTRPENNVKPGYFSGAQEIELLKRYALVGPSDVTSREVLHNILMVCTQRADWSVLHPALRQANTFCTITWVGGGYAANQPRYGEITSLVDDPGNAFMWDGRYIREDGDTKAGRVGIIQPMLLANGKVRREAIELLNALIPRVMEGEQYATMVKPYLDETFGNHIKVWDTFLGLVEGWDGTFTELVEAACALSEFTPDITQTGTSVNSECCEQVSMMV